MGFINDDQGIVRQVVIEGGRRLASVAARKITGIVLNAGAVAQFLNHLHIVTGALLQPLRLYLPILLPQFFQPQLQFGLDLINGIQQNLPRSDIVGFGEHG